MILFLCFQNLASKALKLAGGGISTTATSRKEEEKWLRDARDACKQSLDGHLWACFNCGFSAFAGDGLDNPQNLFEFHSFLFCDGYMHPMAGVTCA